MSRRFQHAKDYVKDGLARGFRFDGCTGVPNFNVKPCCDVHDYDYQDLSKGKLRSDFDFLKCMLNRAKKGSTWKRVKTVAVALTYYAGVSVFGYFYWKRKQNENPLRNVDPVGSERM